MGVGVVAAVGVCEILPVRVCDIEPDRVPVRDADWLSDWLAVCDCDRVDVPLGLTLWLRVAVDDPVSVALLEPLRLDVSEFDAV